MSLDDVNLLGAGRERVEDGVAPLSRAESLASVGHRALSRTESLASVGHGTLSWAQSKSADGHGSLHDEAAETTVLVPMENHEPRLPDIDGVEVVHAAFSRTESASAKSDAALSHRALGELLFVFPVVVLIGSNRLDLIGCRSIENDHIESLCSNCLRNTSRLTTHRSVNSVVNLDRNGLAVYLAENGEEHNASSSHGFRTMREEENESEGLARLEYFQGEESEMLKRGQDQASKLLEWYKERLQSVQKKARLLQQGSVSLDPAVHEQKLNFLRAHITELNRRILAVMETSDKGFPAHHNKTTSNGPANGANDDQLVWLHRQNQRLNQELAEKTQMIDQLKRENELVKKNQMQRADRSVPILRPSAFVRPAYQIPTVINNNNHLKNPSPHKIYDTLM